MSKLLEIKDLYQRSIPRLNEQQVWENVLISISRYWKLSFREALLICVQNPSASTIATFSTWNKVKRSVIAGEKAIVTMSDDNKLKYGCALIMIRVVEKLQRSLLNCTVTNSR